MIPEWVVSRGTVRTVGTSFDAPNIEGTRLVQFQATKNAQYIGLIGKAIHNKWCLGLVVTQCQHRNRRRYRYGSGGRLALPEYVPEDSLRTGQEGV